MNFHISLWIVVAVLDIVFRTAGSFLLTFNPILALYAIKYSAVHFLILVLNSFWPMAIGLRPLVSAATTLFVTNILFCSWFIVDWLHSMKIGRTTFCSGIENYECLWIGGTLTSHGIRWLAFQTLFQLVFNLIPVGIGFILNCTLWAWQREADVKGKQRM